MPDIINVILIVLISLIPIVAWAYIFSYVDDNALNKKRFFVGLIGGALGVVPILYIDKILDIVNFEYINTFFFVYKVKDFFSSMEFSFSLQLLLLLLAIFSLILGFFVHRFRGILKIYFRNILVFFFLVFLVGFFVFGLNYLGFSLGFLNSTMDNGIVFGDIVFNSVKLIIFYYLIVAFIEEASKHFNFIQSSVLQIDSIKTGVLYAIFVALGFALIENILYFYSLYSKTGLSSELVSTYFYRSIFSVMVHILSSSVVAYYFSKALILYRKKDLSFPYLKIFLFGLFWGIVLHMFFDVALSLGFSFVIILYLVGGYLYVSSIFYRD